MKVRNLWLVLMLSGMLTFGLFAAGCDPEEDIDPDPGEEIEDPIDDEEEVDEEALDEDEVLRDAADDYFAQVATDNNMTPSEDIKDQIEADPDSLLIIDVRSAEDFEEAHIEGSVHSTVEELSDIMENIPQDRDVYIACYSGQNAGYATSALRMAGFDNVTTLFYGIDYGWTYEDRGNFDLEGSGMNAAADLDPVSEPATEEEEILWEQAQDIISTGPNWITVDEHEEMHESLESDPGSYHVVDIRSEEDYEEGHIAGAEQVNWGEVDTIIDDLPTTVPVVVACYSGQTGAQTTGVLNMVGLDNANNLLYGVRDGWVERSDLPLVTE